MTERRFCGDHVFGNTAPDARTVLFFGNCQTVYLAMILAAAEPQSEMLRYVCVTREREIQEPITQDGLADVVLYLRQYANDAHRAVHHEIEAALPNGCPVVVFPSFLISCLWPFAMTDPRNKPEESFPFGRFPTGDFVGLMVAETGLTGDAAYERYMALSADMMPDLDNRLMRDIALIDAWDAESDVTVGDLVKEDFRQRHMFWIPGHVDNQALCDLATRIYVKAAPLLGRDIEDSFARIAAAAASNPGMGGLAIPIHPAVASTIKLEFYHEDMRFNWFERHWTFREFIIRYIAFDTNW